MLIPSGLVARSDGLVPQGCKPFTLQSNVCVGDLIAIIACSIAGVGFLFWSIHAFRKMRQFPFVQDSDEEKEEPTSGNDRVGPFHVPSALDDSLVVQSGVVRTPSPPERVRTRMLFTHPEEEFYQSAPMSVEAYYVEHAMATRGSVTMPRTPPRAGGTSSRRSSRHGSLSRGGRYGEGYGYGLDAESMRNASSSRAKGSLERMPSGDYECRQSMRCVNGDATGMTYPYAY